jgi:nicotinate-nucleotide pyrophosphorylase (carboxylating)
MGIYVTADSAAYVDELLSRALAEDLGAAGDVTSNAIFSPEVQACALIRSKGTGVLSGATLIEPLFRRLHPDITIATQLTDGAELSAGMVIAHLEGSIRAILAGERIILNLLQRLSGIATQTAQLCAAISHTSTRLLDTRKTTPALRLLEKQAVVHGGGVNHRFGLFDMVLIKDTHVKAAGGVGNAIGKARAFLGADSVIKIEAEVQSVAEFKEALALRPDRIMLDNMDVPAMRGCVELRNAQAPGVELEASGNVTLKTIVPIAETGVDFISVGSITHSVQALDIHLVIVDS